MASYYSAQECDLRASLTRAACGALEASTTARIGFQKHFVQCDHDIRLPLVPVRGTEPQESTTDLHLTKRLQDPAYFLVNGVRDRRRMFDGKC